ncbi:N-acetylglucosamine kinase [Dictyobacter arantiisoli]|uniref:N-acetylglucosamine kinase n=1 Tax=Dictyobacter arantiisoli TaxID=2014874 RepID=A0A5A5T5C4_9CHLR|nr:BadF/BadG/BcrA/BcrD ATPase family protein [Dictyobacter arantiisoli]GCF06488.1 N-acetylglucosamine kinase [Dictyobacter arantiisoli]
MISAQQPLIEHDPQASYYLGVDGGGSKTLAIVVNAQGEEIARGVSGSSNYTGVGLTTAVQNIYDAVAQARRSLGEQVILQQAWLGLAGVDRLADQQIIEPHLRALASTVYVTNDAELALSSLPDAVGIVLIAGTGSISLGRNAQGITTRAGGWGHILGDEGSGYALGLQALQAAVRAADGRGPQTLLLEIILAYWQLQQADDIIGVVYANEDKAQIAALSRCIFQAERAGDAVAHTIVENNLTELVQVVKAVSTKLGFTSEQAISLALGGGLILNETSFQERFLTQLQHTQAIREIIAVEQPALSAARSVIHLTDFQDWIRV